jgi:predicted DNA-binding transcriptional regulator AlpA
MNKKIILTELLNLLLEGISEEDLDSVFANIAFFGDDRLNKVGACKFLNMSRATFDRKVKAGELPKGKKIKGWKELCWSRKELNRIISTQLN